MSRMIIPLIAVFVLLFSNIALAEDTSKDAQGFRVDWTCEDSLINHVCYVDIYNTDLIDWAFSSSDSFKASLKFSDSSVNGIKATVYKWTEGLTKTVPDCQRVEKTCDYSEEQLKNLNLTEKDTPPKDYDCSYDDCSKNEDVEYADWVLIKDSTFADAKTSEKAYLDAPSLKYGEWQSYKVEYQTPIGFNNGFGSLGKIAFYEEDSKEEYHPWWNSSWARCKNLTLSGASVYNYVDEWVEKNLTALTFANVNELRIVNASCGNDGSEIAYDVINSTASSAYVGFYATFTNGTNQVYSLYYNNTGASAPSRTSVFNYANTTDVNTTVDSVRGYTLSNRSQYSGYADGWSLWNSTGTSFAHVTSVAGMILLYDGAYSSTTGSTRTSLYTGNLTYRMRMNKTSNLIDYNLEFYKNKVRLVAVDMDSGQANMNMLATPTEGTRKMSVNNSTNSIYNWTAGDVKVVLGEKWTASYSNASSYTVGQLATNIGVTNTRLVLGGAGNVMLEADMGSAYLPTNFSIDDDTILEWRIMAKNSSLSDDGQYYAPVHEAYDMFAKPLAIALGTEQLNANPIAITLTYPTNTTYYAKWIWWNATLNTSASKCLADNGASNYTMLNDSLTNYYYNKTITVNGGRNLKIWCNDSTNAFYNSTQIFYTVYRNRSLNVNMTSPTNTTYNANWIWANATINNTAFGCLVEIYPMDMLGTLPTNYTLLNDSSTHYYLNQTLPMISDYAYKAKIYCNDSTFNESYESPFVYFSTIFPEPIAITLDYPTNTTYYNTSAIDCNATLNVSTDYGCNCSIDGTNYTMSNDTSLTYYKTNNSVIEGSHTAQVFCKDKASIVYNSSLIYFYTIPPPESWSGYEVTNGGDTTFTDKAGNMLDKGTGNIYAVLENSSYILVEVSSDEGFNWTLLNKSNATTNNHILSMIKDNDLIHIITFNNTSSMLRYRYFNTTDSTLSAPVNTTNATYVTSITPLYVVESVNATHDALCYAIRTPVSTNKFYPVCMYRVLASTGAFTDGTSGSGVIVSNSTSYPIFNVYKTGTQWYGMMCYSNNSLKELGCNDYTINNMTAKSNYKVNNTPAMTYVRVVSMVTADNGQLRAFFGDGVVNATDYKMKSSQFSNVSRTWGSVEIETYLPLTYNYTYKDSVTRDSDGYCHMIERASNNTTTLADDYLVYKKSSNTLCQFDQTQPEINILAYLNETNISNIKDIRAMSPTRDDRMSFIYGVNTTDIFYAELPRGLMIAVFNEETLQQINNWDLLITSPTNSSLITNISSIYLGSWTEDLAIRISKAGFYDRYYYVDMSAVTGYILNAYLLNTSDGQVVNFLVTDQQDVPLEDVHITARRNIGGVWMIMEEKDTDASGAGSMFLNPDIEYYMSFNKTGYPVYQPLLFPTLTDYVIKLGISTYTMWNSQFEGITFYRLMPVYPTYRNNTILNNEFMITSTNGTLEYWGMNITFGNSSLLYSNSSNTSTGGRMNYSHNWTNAECNTSWFYNGTCNLTVSYFFKGVNNSDIYGDSRTYYITNSTSGYSLWGAMGDITSWGVNTSYAMFMLILFIALIAGGMIAKMHGAMAGAVVAEMILFVAVYMQWMDSTVWLLSLIILGAVGMAMSDRSPD